MGIACDPVRIGDGNGVLSHINAIRYTTLNNFFLSPMSRQNTKRALTTTLRRQ